MSGGGGDAVSEWVPPALVGNGGVPEHDDSIEGGRAEITTITLYMRFGSSSGGGG